MYDTNDSTRRRISKANQGNRPFEVITRARTVGLIGHSGGTLRLFEDPDTGNLMAEVIGFTSDASRRFLDALGSLPDICDEILVCDRPQEYPLDYVPVRERHIRRRSS